MKAMKKQVDDPGGSVWLAARKKNNKHYRVQKKRKRKRTERGRLYVEGRKKDDSTTRWW
jgi:hypothetical protein